jgi:signal transduction histidine kinase
VEDDGQGCAPEALPKLFQPLYSTKKERGGTGLGLYMVKAIMEAHGGFIRAVSKNAWGAGRAGMIFCLEFPASKEPGIIHKRNALNRLALPVEDIAG